MRAENIYIHQTNALTPLGLGIQTQWQALLSGKSAIQKHSEQDSLSDFYAALLDKTRLDDAFQQIATTSAAFTHLEKMLILALQPLIEVYGVHKKTGLIISTTKGNIHYLKEHKIQDAFLPALGKKIAQYFNFQNQPIIISNACISGVLAVSAAKRYLQMNHFDDAYVVAGDEITEFVLSGFQSFQAMSDVPCQPFDQKRKGVNLGEAAAAVYISKEKEKALVEIIGESNCNDANHISGPSRTGEGLFLSIRAAMKEALVQPQDIDFISAHGTATLYNDEMEAVALNRLRLQNVSLHSLKGYFGHTLGASGLLELVFLIESMQRQKTIPSKGYETSGLSEPLNIVTSSEDKNMRIALKTASGFGGCNAALLLRNMNNNEGFEQQT